MANTNRRPASLGRGRNRAELGNTLLYSAGSCSWHDGDRDKTGGSEVDTRASGSAEARTRAPGEHTVTESLVLTLIGDDRPGLVEALANVVTEHGGNWEESRMSRLAGKFAGILQVSVAERQTQDLVRALGELESAGLRLLVEPSRAEERDGECRTFALELLGHDRPGIIREISQALAGRGVNVEELTSGCTSAPMSGELLFSACARLCVPKEVSVDELRDVLEALASDLMVDLTLAEAEEE
jgi:glycine cleavage system regulatory protein